MKKGINVWSFGDMSLDAVFRTAQKAGFQGLELALDMDGALTGRQSGPAQWKQIKQMADEAGIALYSVASGLYWDFNYTSGDADKRKTAKEITRKQLEMAAYLGCDTILVVPGAVGVDFISGCEVVDYRTAYERAGEALCELAKDAQRLGVSIGVENVWNKFLVSPLEMSRFIDEIGSAYVGSYLDIGNTLYNGYPEHWITALGKRIKKVHFKDYRRAAGGLHGFVDLLAGDVDWTAVMSALAREGYDGWVTAEMIPQYAQYTDQIVYNTSGAMDRILAGR